MARWNLSDQLAFFSRIESAEVTGRTCRIIDLNLGSSARGTLADAIYSATKAAPFRNVDSIVLFGHDQDLRIFEMAAGAVETEMPKSMPVHDFHTEGDWTNPEQVTDLALGSGHWIRTPGDMCERVRTRGSQS